MTRDEFEIRAEEANQARIARWKALMAQDGDDLDDDGYPTDLACERIKAWHWSDKAGWMNYVKSMWYLAEW